MTARADAAAVLRTQACRVLHLDAGLVEEGSAAAPLARPDPGLAVEAVRDRDGFAAALAARRFDLVVAEDALPGFGALAALALAQERAPGTPLIILSGTPGEEAAVEAIRRGAADYVTTQRLGRLGPAMRRALSEARADRHTAAGTRPSPEPRPPALAKAGATPPVPAERRQHGLADAIDEGVMIVERLPLGPDGSRDWRYVAVDPAARALFGLPDVTGDTVRAHAPDEDGFWHDLYDRVLDTGRSERVERLAASRGMVLSVSVARLAHSAGPRVMVMMHDITARRRMEEALRESEARYRQLFEAMDEGFCIIEFLDGPHGPLSDYLHVEANAAFARHAGIPDVAGRRVRDTVPDEAEGWVARYRPVLLTGEPIRFEQELVATGRRLELAAFRIEPASRRQVAVLFQDVTARHRAEAALRDLNGTLETRVRAEVAAREDAQARLAHAQRMEALGQLAGGIAHDFNNVLQAVQGGARLIQARLDEPDRVRRLAGMIAEAAARGASITRRLLAFSRRADLRAEPIDAAALLGDLGEILVHTLGRGIEVRVQVPPQAPVILADKGQLETVLVNLATNARDAMAGIGTVILSAVAETVAATAATYPPALRPGAYIRLSVSDTGTGMDAAILARATEPFFTTKRAGKGTGLGLAMARGFAEQSGGALAIESAPGRGTTVCMWLPVTAAAPGAGRGEDAPSALRLDGATVLLVDDEALVRQVMAEGLRAAGYAVLPASGAAEALEIIRTGTVVDVLVSDLSMPTMDGLALVREAQARRPGLPAILLTGFATDAAEIAVSEALAGSFTLLRKPIAAGLLSDRIGVVLEGAEAVARARDRAAT